MVVIFSAEEAARSIGSQAPHTDNTSSSVCAPGPPDTECYGLLSVLLSVSPHDLVPNDDRISVEAHSTGLKPVVLWCPGVDRLTAPPLVAFMASSVLILLYCSTSRLINLRRLIWSMSCRRSGARSWRRSPKSLLRPPCKSLQNSLRTSLIFRCSRVPQGMVAARTVGLPECHRHMESKSGA